MSDLSLLMYATCFPVTRFRLASLRMGFWYQELWSVWQSSLPDEEVCEQPSALPHIDLSNVRGLHHLIHAVSSGNQWHNIGLGALSVDIWKPPVLRLLLSIGHRSMAGTSSQQHLPPVLAGDRQETENKGLTILDPVRVVSLEYILVAWAIPAQIARATRIETHIQLQQATRSSLGGWDFLLQ